MLYSLVRLIVLACDSMQSALYTVLPSVRLSVRPLVIRVDQSKSVEVRIIQFSPYSCPIPLFLWDKFQPEILTGSLSGGVKQEWSGETNYFLTLCVNISKTVRNTSKVKVTIMTNRKLHMRFRLAPTTKVDELG